MTQRDGGPAFPCSGDDIRNSPLGSEPFTIVWRAPGMSLRDWFAGQVLTAGLINNYLDRAETARAAYGYADAMLAERAKEAS